MFGEGGTIQGKPIVEVGDGGVASEVIDANNQSEIR